MVDIEGTMARIADTGEQLAWLGAACQATLDENKISYSEAFIAGTNNDTEVVFNLDFQYGKLRSEELDVIGTCWHALFNSLVIVKEFPILARKQEERCLEISVTMMAFLGEAYRATNFDGHIVIKGFSTMFVPTQRLGDSVLWHFLYNENETRISYLAAQKNCFICAGIETVDYACLESTRSFLGWASSATLQTGKIVSSILNIINSQFLTQTRYN